MSAANLRSYSEIDNEGRLQYCTDLRVSSDELKHWPADVIRMFFDGVAQVVGAIGAARGDSPLHDEEIRMDGNPATTQALPATETNQSRDRDQEYLATAFTYHAPHGDQPRRYEQLRAAGRGLAADIITKCPSSRERSLALTNLEQAMFWANASIARNERDD